VRHEALWLRTHLAEVTLNATPQELRRMAAFLAACADEMERMGDTCSHVRGEAGRARDAV